MLGDSQANPTASSEPAKLLEAQALLQQLAKVLRDAQHLEPTARAGLANLLLELGRDLAPANLPPAELEHLTAHVTDIVQQLQQPHPSGVVAVARAGLQRALIQAEVKAPLTAGFLRRLVDALGALGI